MQSVREYFDLRASTWDNSPQNSSTSLEYALKKSCLQINQRILDIGCGTGILFPFILKAKPSLILGVDISNSMLNKAQQKFNQENLRLLAADFLSLRISGFDRAFLYNSYPHLLDKEKLAKKLSKALVPKGRFSIIHCPGKEAINEIHIKKGATKVSAFLHSADRETVWFLPWFTIDHCIDTNELFFISGYKR